MARKTKARKSAKPKTYKDNLTWTDAGWCKRIGKVSILGYRKGGTKPENYRPIHAGSQRVGGRAEGWTLSRRDGGHFSRFQVAQ